VTRFRNAAVASVFEGYPRDLRDKLMVLRELIFATAAATPGVGELEETLKWGEPAYLTTQSKIGSTVRIGLRPAHPAQYAMYFHCQTTLIERFRTLFPDELKFDGNRAIVFERSDALPTEALSLCIAAALTYHRKPVTP
jgi:Domain of unknown function (DU1801)